jgi:NAD(P) transhydrogenase subunit alpha
LNIAVPLEMTPGERRVALVPDSVKRLVDRKVTVTLQAGAGAQAGLSDAAYSAVGATIEADAAKLYAGADVLLKVRPLGQHPIAAKHEVDLLREGATVIGLLLPFAERDAVRRLAARRITSFSLDLLPRITRAQSMDVLSSQSTIAGYRVALLAASKLPKLMPMLMTAAGTLTASRVLVIGAGVAGLQAIATSRRLGAVVEAYDVRAATKEQVQSLGARFVELPGVADASGAGGYAREQTAEEQAQQRELLSKHIAEADAVICTALVPGRPAPKIVTEEQVERMRAGSVIVDLAAEAGGNCSLTKPGETVVHGGVEVIGPLNVASAHPLHASQMFSRNFLNYLGLFLDKEGNWKLDLDDELVRVPMVTREGAVANESVKSALGG